MYAILEIDEPTKAFIRRDSSAVIRRRFGVAGSAFVDISRGSGEELDWSYAVIEAKTERAPTDSISALIDDTREKVFPILDNVGRITKSLAEIVEHINSGEGTVGYLMSDTTLAREIENSVKSASQAIGAISQLIEGLQKSSDNIGSLTGYAAGPEGVPAMLRHADEVVVAARKILNDLAAVSQRMPTIAQNIEGGTSGLPTITESVKQGTANLPAISRNIEGATASLPALLTQLQVTIQKLDQLIAQIRSSWLLGGGKVEPQEPRQFSPSQVLP
jgi:phospholipid/cholesterol/gamma-HCH transport system substrate-binding protein